MSEKQTPSKRGWAIPANANKAHYFVEGRALCSKWMWFGEVDDGWHDHRDNCMACRKKRDVLERSK